jgi:hypothetical protein
MQPAAILFHKQFAFKDGATADKLLIVLGTTSTHLVVVKTTSQGARYRNDHGCQAGNRFPAFLLTIGCCLLRKNTWVCLSEFYEIPIADMQAKIVAGDVNQLGLLPNGIARDVQVCAVGCDDISQSQEQTVRACFLPP